MSLRQAKLKIIQQANWKELTSFGENYVFCTYSINLSLTLNYTVNYSVHEVKKSDFIFFNKIEICLINNHSPKKCYKYGTYFRDIELQSCPFGDVQRDNIGKEWDRIYGASNVWKWINNDCSYPYFLTCIDPCTCTEYAIFTQWRQILFNFLLNSFQFRLLSQVY